MANAEAGRLQRRRDLAAIYKWCRTDKIRSRKIGGKIFIEVSSLPSERKNV